MPDERKRIVEILDSWFEKHRDLADADVEELVRAHPELADQLREEIKALELLDRAFPGSAAASMPPSTIGEFRILREIGRGGMGVVYEAEQESMQRRVALKVLSLGITGTDRAVRRFQIEARAAGRLQHTNIVPVYSMGQHAGYWYYAMELVQGRPLSDVLDGLRAGGGQAESSRDWIRGTTSVPGAGDESRSGSGSSSSHAWFCSVAGVFAGVAEALDLAHAEGIVHRDVKPSNLLLDVDGRLKLVDFGLAHLEGNGPTMTRTGDVLGTPAYMSPEQVLARGARVDSRTDIYSLGATLYEVLTLKPPFVGDNAQELYTQIVHVDPVPPRASDRAIPRDLETIVLKAMEKERGKRYQRASDLAQDLRRFCEGTAVRARRIGLLGRSWRRVKRRKAVSSLVGALLVIGLIGGLLTSSLRNRVDELQYGQLLWQAASVLPTGDEEPVNSAIDLYTEAIELDPDRPYAYWLRALAGGRPVVERMEDIDKARELGLAEGTAHRLRGYVFTSARQPVEARRELELAQRLTPELTATDEFAQAYWSYRVGRTEQGLQFVDAAVHETSSPSGRRAPEREGVIRYLSLRLRAHLLEQQERLAEALTDLNAIQGLGDDSLRVRVHVASLWKNLPNEEGERLFETLLVEVQKRSDSSSIEDLARICHGYGEFEWMHRATVAGRTAYPESLKLKSLHADALTHVGEPAEALALASEVAASDLTRLFYRTKLAEALVNAEKLEDAVEVYEEVIGLGGRPHVFLGVLLMRLERWPEAARQLRLAIERDPRHLRRAYDSLAEVYRNLGQPDELIALYREMAEVLPNARSHSLFADALRERGQPGDLQEAAESYRKAIELADGNSDLHNNLGYVLRELGDLHGSIESIQQAIARNTENLRAYLNLYTSQSAHGREAEALATLEKAHELAVRLEPNLVDRIAAGLDGARRRAEEEHRAMAIASGEAVAASPQELVQAANHLYHRQSFVSAVQTWEKAFAASPALLEDLDLQARYDAACAAALAFSGEGDDAGSLSPGDRARLRRLALGWLRDDLEEYRQRGQPALVLSRLRHWLNDPDLASLRNPDPRGMSEDEAESCRAFWRDVRAELEAAFSSAKGESVFTLELVDSGIEMPVFHDHGPGGELGIVYGGGADASGGLRFSRGNLAGRPWTTEIVDDQGTCRGFAYAPDGTPSLIYTVDGDGALELRFMTRRGGFWPSYEVIGDSLDASWGFAYDPDGNASVSYRSKQGLCFAKRIAGTWDPEIVEATNSCHWNSLAYDPLTGVPVIAYSDDTDGDDSFDVVKLARWDPATSNWIEDIAGRGDLYGQLVELSIDPTSGSMAIAHLPAGEGGLAARLLRSSSSGWRDEPLLERGKALGETWTHVAYDGSGTLWIAYGEPEHGRLSVMHEEDGGWVHELVDGTATGGYFDIGPDGRPTVSYRANDLSGTPALWFARK